MPTPPKVLCAPNALKGTLSAVDAAHALASGVRRVFPEATAIPLPIADGGDGTREILTVALGGVAREAQTTDPLGRPVTAAFGVVQRTSTGIVDVASASGLVRLRTSERDPMRASSRGTGVLLRHALDGGLGEIVLGVGGSASVDGGTGLMHALGARFLDAQGFPVAEGGAGLAHIAELDLRGLVRAARAARIVVVCDVDNPLLGESGAARVFGPQKGAGPEAVRALEAGLANLASVVERTLGRDMRCVPRGGAAGGIAATLWAVLDARLVAGIDFVLDAVGFDAQLRGADLVLTSEGRLDAGSFGNKGPVGVARRAAHRGVPTFAVVGSIASEITNPCPPFAGVLTLDSGPTEVDAASTLARLEDAAARAVIAARQRGIAFSGEK